MRELTATEIEDAGGGVLANVGMGMAGMTGGMALYAASNWGTGLTGNGFISAATGGFVTGALGFSPAAQVAGAGVAGIVGKGIREDEDS